MGETLVARLDGLPLIKPPGGYVVFAEANTTLPFEFRDDGKNQTVIAYFRLENEDGDEAKARLGRQIQRESWWPFAGDVRFQAFGTVALTFAFQTPGYYGAMLGVKTSVSLFCATGGVRIEIERWTITALAVDTLKVTELRPAWPKT